MSLSERHRHLAVVPTLRRHPDQLIRLTEGLLEAGVAVKLVVTGRTLRKKLLRLGVDHITSEQNPGFSKTIHYGAASADWDWLYIVNDDVTIGPQLAAVVTQVEQHDSDDLHLFFIDPERRRPLPTTIGVFTSVALLDPLLVRARARRGRESVTPDIEWYKSFSCVCISRRLWDLLGGLDPSFPYTYEDADFTRRARAAGAEIHEVTYSAVAHEGSSTSRRHIGRVLPVSVWSARRYLISLGHHPAAAAGLLTAALALRTVFAPFADADVPDHVRGIGKAIAGVWRPVAPSLPSYQEN